MTKRRQFGSILGEAIREFVRRPKELGNRETDYIGLDDVLIDIPRRKLDKGGVVYIDSRAFGGMRALHEVSRPVEAIISNYQELTTRIRVFISPRLDKVFPKEQRRREREEISKLILQATSTVKKPTQLQ